MVVAFDEAQNTLNTLKRLRTDGKFSELFARALIIADRHNGSYVATKVKRR